MIRSFSVIAWSFIITLFTSCFSDELFVKSLDELNCDQTQATTITYDDAICLIVGHADIKIKVQEFESKIKEKNIRLDGWLLYAVQRNDSSWYTSITSRGVIPAYQCTASFDNKGQLLTDVNCSYNK
ncbi:MAG: hypothetical protein ABJF11_00270 [Reichenbachiella sp.]|uniref:hypothetical protein n=1 Tax=Reichenbachiella sp. TaxID=2184521 RepID=UPI0032678E44